MAKEDEENEKIRVEESVLTENLPEVLILEILSYLPVKSLLRFRCVCKFWYDLITDSAFVKMHLRRSLVSNTNLNVVFINLRSSFNLVGFLVSELHRYSDDLDVWEQEVVVRHPFKLPHYLGYVVGSCNGLLCLMTCNSTKREILLWNPSTRRHQKLPSIPKEISCFGSTFNGKFEYIVNGFGHDPTTDDYKFVRIVKFRGALDSLVTVFSLRTNSWRRVGNMPFCLNKSYFSMLFANSALHWIANREPEPNTTSSFIGSFDLQDEEYRELPLPDFDFVKNNAPMKLAVLGGQLCVLWPFLGVRVEVWLMKEYGVRDSWEKQFSIEQPRIEQPWVMRNLEFLRPICYSKTGEVILQIDLDAVVLFDPRRRRVRNLIVYGAPDLFEIESFVGSLVPLNAKDGTYSCW
ncbi:hypothetical protein NE237_015288 [Protea cynaroides]|uniref:F-box domain-containing protein n=1 Tax=Protea cynaroides TaxID=273540 RepID=A0A9Q0KDR2_9MAGN|nr:hypothetical protein NE237_015288 [Protea cynaroides]